MKENIINDFKLPKYIKGKSFAEASKVINNKFKDRNDKISQDTKEELLSRLAEAQEHIKELENVNQPDTNQQSMGGYSNDYFYGGAANTGGGGNNFMNVLGGATQAFSGQAGQSNQDMQYSSPEASKYLDEDILAKQNTQENIKDGVATAFPIAGIFRGVEKMGKNLGQAVGGDAGGSFATGILDPMSNKMRDDYSIGEKIAGIDPLAAGMLAMTKDKKLKQEAYAKRDFAMHNNATRDFAMGGNIDEDNTPIDYNMIDDTFSNLPISDNASLYDTDSIEPTKSNNFLNKTGKTLGNAGKATGKYLGENYGNILRYAPVAMNAFQLANLDKPEVETLQKLDSRYRPDPFDVNTLTNKIENQYSGLKDRLASAGGGSASALRSSLLGSQIGKTQAISDAYTKAEMINRDDRSKEQSFNLGIDKFNIGQSNQEKDINARNRAAYQNNKSKLLSQLGTDVGKIGKEEVTKKQVEKIFGYDWKGKYKKENPKATKKEINEALKTELLKLSSDENAYGGYLKNKK